MKRKAVPVATLAREAGVDIDLVLVTLWDLGATKVGHPNDVVPSRFVDAARRSLGVATKRDMRKIPYWAELLGQPEADLRAHLAEEGIRLEPNRTKLPPKAVRILKATARSKGIDPATGVIRKPKVTARPRYVRHQPLPTPAFSGLGRLRELRLLNAQEIETIHNELVVDFANSGDPIDPPGIRDEHLLESAMFRPQTGIGGIRKYPTVETSAAALLYSLIHNHPFHNGNKRTALVATLVFLDENDTVLTCSEDDIFKFVLVVAQHRVTDGGRQDGSDYETYAVAQQLCRWSRAVNKDERVMAFRKYRPILGGYDCSIDISGNKANIVREKRRDYWGLIKRRRTLHTQVHYDGEGRDVPPETVKKIRRDLELGPIHGIDSVDFYSKKPLRTDEFIVKYKNTLRRLASL